jgi:hypothetical protein
MHYHNSLKELIDLQNHFDIKKHEIQQQKSLSMQKIFVLIQSSNNSEKSMKTDV